MFMFYILFQTTSSLRLMVWGGGGNRLLRSEQIENIKNNINKYDL